MGVWRSVCPACDRDGRTDLLYRQPRLRVLRTHGDGRKEEESGEVPHLAVLSHHHEPAVSRIVYIPILVVRQADQVARHQRA